MSENNLHGTVKEFKQFINEHPKLREEIRRSGRTWQEYYEKWILLGEDDAMWEPYKNEKNTSTEKEKNPELFQHLLKIVDKMDFDKVQKNVHQLNETVSILQEVVGQFKNQQRPQRPHLKRSMNWFRD
ncbi:MAG TPA: spore coat protein YlbD [Bacillota bacterium]